MSKCHVCFRQCEIEEGARGFCGARGCVRTDEGTPAVVPLNYGRLTALALDPIEKKPLARFYPGSMILSAGSYGCNLRCPFCQNHEISWSDQAMQYGIDGASGSLAFFSPEELAGAAVRCRAQGNIGVAFTYNEPLIGFEYVRDAARLVHEAGMKNVLVTNGTASLKVLEELAPYIDAMNIDLKGFTDDYYNRVLGGSRQMVMSFIEQAVQICHVELTCLIVPGENDREEEIREMTAWIASLPASRQQNSPEGGRWIPLHITRFFPQFHMTDRPATDVGLIYRLADAARDRLKYVYTGNC